VLLPDDNLQVSVEMYEREEVFHCYFAFVLGFFLPWRGLLPMFMCSSIVMIDALMIN